MIVETLRVIPAGGRGEGGMTRDYMKRYQQFQHGYAFTFHLGNAEVLNIVTKFPVPKFMTQHG